MPASPAPDLWTELQERAEFRELEVPSLAERPLEEALSRIAWLALTLLGADVGVVTLVGATTAILAARDGGADGATAAARPPGEAAASYGHALAGISLVTAGGHVLGRLCTYVRLARDARGDDLDFLQQLARCAVAEIELRAVVEAQRRRQEAASRAARLDALRQLATGLRHEVNNALTGLILQTDLLARSPVLDENGRRSAQMAKDEALRISAAIHRLNDIEQLAERPCVIGGEMIDLSSP